MQHFPARVQPSSSGFQGRIIHIRGQRPGHSRSPCPPQDLGYGTARHATTLGDLPVAELARLVQSQDVVDLSHRHSLRWHRWLLPLRWRGHDTEGCGGRASRFARNRIRRIAVPHSEGCRPPIPRTRRIVAGFPSESVAGMGRNTHPLSTRHALSPLRLRFFSSASSSFIEHDIHVFTKTPTTIMGHRRRHLTLLFGPTHHHALPVR